MVRIHYFASIREQLDRTQDELELPSGVGSVEDLVEHLLCLNPHFSSVFNPDKKVLVAINQTIATLSDSVNDGDEVAFFPPMTGG